MIKTEVVFTSYNRRDNIHGFIWECDKSKGVVQLIHGMSEHIDRYDDFASFMSSNGYLVCGHDHAGHGKSATNGFLGDFGDTGYQTLVEDVHSFRSIISEKYPGLSYNMLGHSMGSFVLRVYLMQHAKDVRSVIFSGTAGVVPKVQEFLNKCEKLMENSQGMLYAPEIMSALYGDFNSRYENHLTPFDWLCTDPLVVKDYIDDNLCGIPFTVRTYYTEFCMLPIITGEQWAKKLPTDLPIFIFTGDMDPVANYGEGQYQVVNWLWNTGHKKVKAKLYPGFRHEMLNEPIKQDVYNDVLSFLDIYNE